MFNFPPVNMNLFSSKTIISVYNQREISISIETKESQDIMQEQDLIGFKFSISTI